MMYNVNIYFEIQFFLSFFPAPFPLPCSVFSFTFPRNPLHLSLWPFPFGVWAEWRIFSFEEEEQSSGGLAEWVKSFPLSSGHEVTRCVLSRQGDDGREWAFLGLAWLGEQCLEFASFLGTRFKSKDRGLPNTGLRGIITLSPGAPRVKKTSGLWKSFFSPWKHTKIKKKCFKSKSFYF